MRYKLRVGPCPFPGCVRSEHPFQILDTQLKEFADFHGEIDLDTAARWVAELNESPVSERVFYEWQTDYYPREALA